DGRLGSSPVASSQTASTRSTRANGGHSSQNGRRARSLSRGPSATTLTVPSWGNGSDPLHHRRRRAELASLLTILDCQRGSNPPPPDPRRPPPPPPAAREWARAPAPRRTSAVAPP